MSDQRKKKGLTPAQWAEVRKAYETELPPPSIATLSKRFGVKRDTIQRHRDDIEQPGGPWVPNGQSIGQMTDRQRAAVTERARAKVIDIGTRQAVDTAISSGAMQKIAESAVAQAVNYAELEALMIEFAKDTLERALGKDPKKTLRSGTHTSEAGERKDAMTAAQIAIDKSREMRGKRPGVPSIAAEDEDDGKATKIIFEIDAAPAQAS